MRVLCLTCLAGVSLALLAAARPVTGSSDKMQRLQRSSLSVLRVKSAPPKAARSAPRYADGCPVRSLQPGAVVEEALAPSDCKLRDILPGSRSLSPADQYRITISRRSVLTIREQSSELDATVYLLGEDYQLLASNNDAENSRNSRIRISVQPGTYLIVATSKDVATGSYTLEAQVEDPRACSTTTAPVNTDVAGQIAPGGCRVLDLHDGTDESPVAVYRMQVARNSVVTLSLRSTDFDAALTLYSASGVLITSNDNSRGSTDSEILISLPPGTYTVDARVAKTGGGAFTLRASTEDPRPCVIANLAPNSTQSGELSASDCRVLDLLIGETDDSSIDLYRVRLDSRAILTSAARSRDFDAVQLLLTEELDVVTANDDESSDSTDSRLLSSLPAGSYLLMVNSVSATTGAYRLEGRLEQPRECPVKDLATGTAMNGSLSINACRVLDFVIPSSDEAPAAVYGLTLDRRLRLTADMTSTELDSYLYLLDASYEVVEIDDDSGGNGNARITITAPAGGYYLVATTWDGAAGNFTVNATTTEPRACSVQDLAPNGTYEGALDGSDCTLADMVSGAPAAPVDQFLITVTQRGMLDFTVTSSFPPLAIMANAESGQVVGSDENLSMARTAHIRTSVAAGRYLVLLTSYQGQGTYTVKTTFAAQ